jgi:hypothetical protein
MQDNKSARDKMLSKLQRLGIDTQSSLATDATDEQLGSILVGLEKIRDNKLARFVVTLIQASR